MLISSSSWDYNWELKCYINGYYTSDHCNSSKFTSYLVFKALRLTKRAFIAENLKKC